VVAVHRILKLNDLARELGKFTTQTSDRLRAIAAARCNQRACLKSDCAG